MVIHELARQAGISATTIRYYESIGLMPKPERSANNYRQYTSAAVERLRLISGARGLGFSLEDIADILQARDQGVAPCQRVLDALDGNGQGACFEYLQQAGRAQPCASNHQGGPTPPA